MAKRQEKSTAFPATHFTAQPHSCIVRLHRPWLTPGSFPLNPPFFPSWAVKGKGATLLKGAPGTRKSTVALYRVREMLRALQKNGIHEPRILFTTYTKALTRVSEQLLESLLGKEARFVDVRTADAVAREIASSGGKTLEAAKSKMLREILMSAIEQARYEGNALKVAAQQKTIHALDRNFLLEEIQSVIEARGLTRLDQYMGAVRPGRGAALNKTQREAVWRVREAFIKVLASREIAARADSARWTRLS